MTSMSWAGASPGSDGRGDPVWRDDDERRGDDGVHVNPQRDALTGLPNRLGWDETITRADASRAEAPMTASVIVLEVDYLTRASDARAPDVGDELLRTVTLLVRGVLREQDLVARIGGDELAVLLPSADEPACAKVVTRLRDAFASSASLEGLPISVAVGFATAAGTETLTRAHRWAVLRMFEERAEPIHVELLTTVSPAASVSEAAASRTR